MSKQKKPKNAIALHYDGKNAPRITAKGRGSVAEEIIALAELHGVPLHEDSELVGLLAQLELNDTIPRELYLAVAEVIAFAYRLTERFPPGWGPDGKRDDEGI
ncbi:MAG: EscU/YscU/HrcU family type III secretion system export apparatus switch protein [Thiohalomonadaceae bacterium]